MKRSISVAARLSALPLLTILLATLVLGYFGHLNSAGEAEYAAFASASTDQARASARLEQALTTSHARVNFALLQQSTGEANAELDEIAAAFEASLDSARTQVEQLQSVRGITARETELIGRIEAALLRYRSETATALNAARTDTRLAVSMIKRAQDIFSSLLEATARLADLRSQRVGADSDALLRRHEESRRLGFALIMVVFATALAGGWWVTWRAMDRLWGLADAMRARLAGERVAIDRGLAPLHGATGSIASTFSALDRELEAARGKLERSSDRVEQLIDERTAVLERTNLELKTDLEQQQGADSLTRRSEREHRDIIEGSLLGAFMHRNGKLVYANRAFVELAGYDNADQVLALESFEAFVTPGDRELLGGYMRARLDGRMAPASYEFGLLRRDGTVRRCLNAVRVVEWENAITVQCFVVDISAHEQARIAVEHARDEAMKAAHSKSEFLANVSHEIRTPMNGVVGAIDLLEATQLDDDQRHLIEIANMSGSALLALIDDILDFSKVEAGKLELEHIPLCPRQVVEDVLDMCAEKAANQGIALLADEAPDTPVRVLGDPSRLRQVVTNLVSNAVKFTSEGHVAIRLYGRGTGIHERRLIIEVADTGAGIAREGLGRIFLPFLQEDGSTTRKFGGTGLGLTIVKEIVNRMRGDIDVQSELGTGSTFRVSLPVQEVPGYNAETTPLRDKRVLLIAEDNGSRRELQSLLTRHFSMNVLTRHPDTRYGWPQADCAVVIVDSAQGRISPRYLADRLPAARFPVLIIGASVRFPQYAEALPQSAVVGLSRPVRMRALHNTLVNAFQTAASEDGTTLESAPAPTPATDTNCLDGFTVLVVDDVAVNRVLTAKMLERLGACTRYATNGAEAVEMVKHGAFDLVLMDCQMPVMDGYEAARAIRSQIGPKASVPIVALTAHAIKGDDDQCYAAGMDDYLPKPISADLLTRKMLRWKSNREAG